MQDGVPTFCWFLLCQLAQVLIQLLVAKGFSAMGESAGKIALMLGPES